MQQKIKHLEFVQQIIDRMAKNSFLIKGWSLTLVVAIISLSKYKACSFYLYLAVIAFFILDFYFVYQEKNFRNLYNLVRLGKVKNFEIKIQYTLKNFFKTMYCIPNLIFYVLMFLIVFSTNR